MIARLENIKEEKGGKGVYRKVLAHGGSLMLVHVRFEKGAIGEIHQHEHEQISYILEGKFEFTIDGKKEIVKKGDSIYIKSNTPHGVLSLEDDSIILDVFYPQREDFKPQK